MNFVASGAKKALTNAEIKNGLKEEGTLFIKEFEYTGQTIKELVLLFGEYSFKYSTWSSKTNKVMCLASKKRSFSDLYCFISHYRPLATVKTVKEKVAEAILEGNIYPTFCGVIDRGVFLYKPYQISGNHNNLEYKNRLTYKTEFGQTIGEFYNIT